MQVTVSRVSPVEVEIHVAVPRDQVSSALERAYADLGKVAQIRGFRRGKVPRPILRQFFGSRVQQDVLKQLVEQTLPGAIEEHHLQPVNQPIVKSSDDFAGTTDWSYTAKVEVRPEIPALDPAALKLQRKVYTIDDHDVQEVLEARREEAATLRTPDPPRPARKGDEVTFDYDFEVDGEVKPEFAARGRTAEVGKGSLLREIDEGLVDLAVGGSREVEVSFPETHARTELRGKTAKIKLTVNAIQEKLLPEVDDELARDLGAESLAALRAKIRGDLEQAATSRAQDELQMAAIEALIEAHPVAAPPSLVEQTVAQVRPELVRALVLQGGKTDINEINSIVRQEAEKRVRGGLLLSELARTNNLKVTEDDLTARLEQLSKETGRAVQKLRAEYRDEARREGLASAVLQDKVLQLVLSKATVTDVPAPTHTHDEPPAAETPKE